MKIAIFAHRMMGHAGIELYSYDLAKALAAMGHVVSVHAPRVGGDWPRFFAGAGVALTEADTIDHDTDACVAPTGLPCNAACETGRPVVQVIHSEHSSDRPTDHRALRAVVCVRNGQLALIGDPLDGVRHVMIRNPVDFARFSAIGDERKEFDRVLVSEFDWFKADLARRTLQRFGGTLLLVGPWYDREHDVPAGATLEPATLDVAHHYRRARRAVSYRLSRCVPEAMLCGLGVDVFGGLEPVRIACTDGDEDWISVGAEQIEIAGFEASRVAREWTYLLEQVA